MPVLKIKKNGTWKEVWGGLGSPSSSLPKLTTVFLYASAWGGSSAPYSQVVNVNGVNAISKVDLQPSHEQIVSLQDSEISLMASNNNGVVTVYAFGGKPTRDYKMQMLITDIEVIA